MNCCRSRPAGGMAYAADLKSAFCGFESRAGYHFQPQKDSNRCQLLPFRLFISRFRRFSKSKQDFGNQTWERAKLFPEVEMAAPGGSAAPLRSIRFGTMTGISVPCSARLVGCRDTAALYLRQKTLPPTLYHAESFAHHTKREQKRESRPRKKSSLEKDVFKQAETELYDICP